jgi:hypothetical protein
MARELHFQLNINREQALRYYQGTASAVIVTTTTGQKLRFPAEHIRSFIDQNGISGLFRIEFDNNHKLIGLQRV